MQHHVTTARAVLPCVALLAVCVITGCESAEAFDAPSSSSASLHRTPICTHVVTREHMVDVGDGVRLHVVERFTLDSLARPRRRALLMLPATLVTSAQWNPDVPGDTDASYNGLIRAARAGYFAYAVTYEGYGASSAPADGSTVTAERLLGEMGEVVEWIRDRTHARRVDLIGSSIGSSLAVALGGDLSPIDPDHIGRVVVTSHVHRDVTPLFREIFFSPELRAMLEGAPNGYAMTTPEAYGLILALATPEAVSYGFATFPGVYATGPTLEGFDLPLFDASHGRAPLLQVWGDADLITPRSDVDQFQAEYGGHAELAVLPGGGHAPNFEPVRDQLWDEVFDFLDVTPGICARHAASSDAH